MDRLLILNLRRERTWRDCQSMIISWPEYPSTGLTMPEEILETTPEVPEGKGLQENFIFRAVYTFCDETGEPALMLGSHVDDLIWACHPKYQ